LASNKSISKTGGDESTLTIKSSARLTSYSGSSISSVSGTPLNVVIWSDYDGDGNDGGVSLSSNITTHGGDIWIGGSDTVNGTLTWNGLNIGDGGSQGGNGYNWNAIDLSGDQNWNTSGGDIWVRVGDGYSGGFGGIYLSNDINLNTGSGNVIIEADQVGNNKFNITSTGSFSFRPFNNSFHTIYSGLNVTGTLNSGIFTGSDDFAEFKFNSFSSQGGFTIGKASNTENITVSSDINIAGPISIYGGDITLSNSLTASGTMLLQSSGAVTQSAAVSATTLSLQGSGTFTLNDTNNHVNTLTAGTSTQTTGNISYQ